MKCRFFLFENHVASINNFLVILIFGALCVLAFLLVANPLKVNKAANRYFGLFLLLWATYWAEEVVELIGLPELSTGFWLGLRFIQFFTPIVFFYSIRFFTNPHLRFTGRDIRNLILPVLYVLVLLFQQKKATAMWLDRLPNILIIGQALFFSIFSLVEIRLHSKRIELFRSDKQEVDLNWIQQIIIALLALSLFISMYNLVANGRELNIIANSFMILIILYVGYFALKQKEIFLVDKDEVDRILEDEATPEIDDPEMGALKSKLHQLMVREKPFLQQELNLPDLAQMMDLSPHDLSHLLNKGFGQNFYVFINRYRVDTAKKMLLNRAYDRLNVLGIAFEAGFNSKTTFNTVFKKETGLTPSEFKKRGSAR